MSNSCSEKLSSDLQILMHHIYEFKKGIRNLVLHTMKALDREKAEALLERRGIAFYTKIVNKNKVNIFFGDEAPVKIIESFGTIPLNEFTNEQDFILGIMLGYDRNQQCCRYIKRLELEIKN